MTSHRLAFSALVTVLGVGCSRTYDLRAEDVPRLLHAKETGVERVTAVDVRSRVQEVPTDFDELRVVPRSDELFMAAPSRPGIAVSVPERHRFDAYRAGWTVVPVALEEARSASFVSEYLVVDRAGVGDAQGAVGYPTSQVASVRVERAAPDKTALLVVGIVAATAAAVGIGALVYESTVGDMDLNLQF